MDIIVRSVTAVVPNPIFKYGLSGLRIRHRLTFPPTFKKPNLARMCILSTSERVGKADKLLTKAKQLLEDYEGSIGLEERKTAEGLLAL